MCVEECVLVLVIKVELTNFHFINFSSHRNDILKFLLNLILEKTFDSELQEIAILRYKYISIKSTGLRLSYLIFPVATNTMTPFSHY